MDTVLEVFNPTGVVARPLLWEREDVHSLVSFLKRKDSSDCTPPPVKGTTACAPLPHYYTTFLQLCEFISLCFQWCD